MTFRPDSDTICKSKDHGCEDYAHSGGAGFGISNLFRWDLRVASYKDLSLSHAAAMRNPQAQFIVTV